MQEQVHKCLVAHAQKQCYMISDYHEVIHTLARSLSLCVYTFCLVRPNEVTLCQRGVYLITSNVCVITAHVCE